VAGFSTIERVGNYSDEASIAANGERMRLIQFRTAASDLSHRADKTDVIADGSIAEFGGTETVLTNPRDARTRSFLARVTCSPVPTPPDP
jgi:ABC-type phosphate transport system ATPase subunit